jgi:hypothetical protein
MCSSGIRLGIGGGAKNRGSKLNRNPVRDASAAHGMAGEHRLDLTDEFG